MEIKRTRSLRLIAFMVLALCGSTAALHAQLSGHNTKGDFGLLAGSQPPPGLYLVAPLYIRYEADTLRNRDGDRLALDFSLDVNAYVLGVLWVSEKKFLGGNYSFQIFPAFTDNALEAPGLGVDESVSTGLTDLYVVPLHLGWQRERADFVAGLGIFAPTGSYEADADDNLGLGMWSFELFGGTTLYFDEARSWHFATNAFYETHTEKEGSDVRVGDLLTLEGGFGKSLMEGAVSVGVAYYAQWKTSDDDLGLDFVLPSGRRLGKHEVFGVGPDVTFPIATKKKLYGFLNARYFWESGARSTLEGSSLLVTATFPIPSIPLQ